MDPKANVQIIDNLKDITQISSQWRKLVRRSNCFEAFSGPLWITHALKDPDLHASVIAVTFENQLRAIWPLVYRENDGRKVYEFPHALLCEWLDIVSEAQDTEFCTLALEALISRLGFRDEVHLINLDKESQILRALSEVLGSYDHIDYKLKVRFPAPYVVLPSSWDDYLKQKSSHFRASARQTLKRFEKMGLTVHPIEKDSVDLKDLTTFFLDSSLERFETHSIYASDFVRQMVLSIFPKFLEEDILHGFYGKIGDETLLCAFEFKRKINERMGFQFAYKSTMKSMGVARFIVLQSVKRAILHGEQLYDLGRTTNELKERVKTDFRNSFGLILKIKNKND